MLIRTSLQRGMSLIELMVGIAVVAILFALGAPSFTDWLQSAQIRTAAEAFQNGLMLARGEAVRRNTLVRFSFADSADNACNVTATGTNWVVSQDDPTGACATPADEAVPPRIIQSRAGAEGSPNVQVAAGQSSIVFNGLGRVTPVPAGDINVSISNPIGGSCLPVQPAVPSPTEKMRCLRIVVSPSGQVRMCDPVFVFSNTMPQGC